MKKYFVYIIHAYDQATPEGQLQNVCTIELIDKSADKALERAKKLISKKEYRVAGIIEKYYDKS